MKITYPKPNQRPIDVRRLVIVDRDVWNTLEELTLNARYLAKIFNKFVAEEHCGQASGNGCRCSGLAVHAPTTSDGNTLSGGVVAPG